MVRGRGANAASGPYRQRGANPFRELLVGIVLVSSIGYAFWIWTDWALAGLGVLVAAFVAGALALSLKDRRAAVRIRATLDTLARERDWSLDVVLPCRDAAMDIAVLALAASARSIVRASDRRTEVLELGVLGDWSVTKFEPTGAFVFSYRTTTGDAGGEVWIESEADASRWEEALRRATGNAIAT